MNITPTPHYVSKAPGLQSIAEDGALEPLRENRTTQRQRWQAQYLMTSGMRVRGSLTYEGLAMLKEINK